MKRKMRRTILAVIVVLIGAGLTYLQTNTTPLTPPSKPPVVAPVTATQTAQPELARAVLDTLEIKGRAPKTGYSRKEFGDGWLTIGTCDTRNEILFRDLQNASRNESCKVLKGTLQDPYTGKVIEFSRGADTSALVQIDHVVALSDAWQKGAQLLSKQERTQLANDPLELLAVDGAANQEKSDGDAATWLPKQKSFRCQYVARQIAVKKKYRLWVTNAERDAMIGILDTCPEQRVPSA